MVTINGVSVQENDILEFVSSHTPDVWELAKSLIPKWIKYIETSSWYSSIPGVVLASVQTDKNLLVEWPKGTGKTTAIYYVAQETKNPLVSIQFTGHTGVDTLLGKWLIRDGKTYWQDGIFTMACRYGFWIVLDEINAALPEVTMALHSALDDRRVIILDEKDGEVINIHPNTKIFATINPSWEYAGTKEMNAALVDRFAIKLFSSYPEQSKEVQIIMAQKSVKIWNNVLKWTKEWVITRIVKVANQLRNTKEKWLQGRISISSRELINWATMCSLYPILEAFTLTVANKTEIGDVAIRDYLNKIASVEFSPDEVWVGDGDQSLINIDNL